MNKEMSIVEMDDALAKRIEVFRLKQGGFQRNLDPRRLPEISAKLSNGSLCPPITVARVDSRHLLIDGQHRFAAWQIKKFPMKVCLVKMESIDQATETFIDMNREQKKIALSHILSVSPHQYAVRCREMAAACKFTITHAHNLMGGIVNSKEPMKHEIPDEAWKRASRVLTFWMKDRRWNREGCIFSTPSALRLVGYFAGRSTALDSILKDLSSLDWSKNGQLSRQCGTSWASQKNMRAIVYKALAERVI